MVLFKPEGIAGMWQAWKAKKPREALPPNVITIDPSDTLSAAEAKHGVV